MFYSAFVYSQYEVVEENRSDTTLKANYSNIMYRKIKGIDSILELYVLIDVNDQDKIKEQVKKFILKNKIKNSIFYFVKSPSYCIDDKEKELFFLNFMCTILGEKKMIDSNLIIISNKNIVTQYESERLNKLEFDKKSLIENFNKSYLCQSYLNEISKLIINPSLNKIYKLIKH